VIMHSQWMHLIIPKKETDHENSRTASHPGRYCRKPAPSFAAGRHGCHCPTFGNV